jgi:hypothetical protein
VPLAPTRELTRPEKLAGRKFRDDQTQKLLVLFDTDPPTYNAPSFLAHWRHECPGRNMISTAIELKEVYVHSPRYEVYSTTDGEVVRELGPEDEPLSEGSTVVPAGEFAFIYKHGVCKAKGCGHVASSRARFFALASERPPVEGRVARSGR